MRTKGLVVFVSALVFSACAQPAQQSAQGISVGPIVQVSAQRSGLEHVEVVADGDPVHPGHLIACSMVQTRPVEKIRSAAYVSTDNGKTWTSKVITPAGDWDPDCHITRDGTMYFAANGGQTPAWYKVSAKVRNTLTYIALWKSLDGGQHFSGPVTFGKGSAQDREWTAIDDSPQSPHYGRAYAWYFSKFAFKRNQAGGMPMENDLVSSKDGGKTWASPVPIKFRANDDFLSHGVVLPDGTLVMFETRVKIQGDENDPDRTKHEPDSVLYAILSHDGGASVSQPIKIADVRIAQSPTTRTVPTISVDKSNGPFKGRIYVTWADAQSGRSVIMAAHSNDSAKTWSTPVKVDDDFWNTDNEKGPDDFMATATVNNQGLVGIMWYDRRDIADDVGYDVRFSASRDGGDTWEPSVGIPGAHNSFEGEEHPIFWPDVNDAAKTHDTAAIKLQEGTWYIGGHTAGLAATADGIFHPVWVDNHTQVQQLYSAPITVTGSVTKNGDPELAALIDLTKDVHVDTQQPSYDRSSGAISVQVRLQNTGHHVVYMPLYVRAIDWNSDIGVLTATNSDNAAATRGAYWRFGQSRSSLAPKANTGWRTLTFHVSNVQSLHRDHQFFQNYLTLSTRVLGTI